MCYITESAIDHDNDMQGDKTCERCGEDFRELFEIEYCLAEVANNWDGTDSKGEPEYITQEVCEWCEREISKDEKYIVV
jgi:hypothetical protein